MSYTATQLNSIIGTLRGVIKRSDLKSKDWKRQTDAVKMQFANAQMFAEDRSRFYLFDAHISSKLKHKAISNGTHYAAQFFNKRCHDKGLVCPRLAILDTKKTRAQGGVNGGLSNLHVHGGILIPEGKDKKWLRAQLRKVFGYTPNHAANRHQIKIHKPDIDQFKCFQNRKGAGISGRTNYMLSHAGTTYNDLKLNDDAKRKRRAPLDKARVNRYSIGLAKGIPTNFCSVIMIWNNQSKSSAKAAFADWIQYYDEAVSDTSNIEQQYINNTNGHGLSA